MYDFIGDIHGHVDELQELLIKLDYRKVEAPTAIPNEKRMSKKRSRSPIN